MPFFLITWLILTILGVAFPGFTKLLNFGFVWPVVALGVGSLSWGFLGLVSGLSLATFPVWVGLTLFIGGPVGFWVACIAEA